MKIKKRPFLAGILAAFCLFCAGFFLGRNGTAPAVVTARTAPRLETMPTIVPTEPAFPLDINSATASELVFLPGVGETIAQRIVEWREANGGFRTAEDLLEVEGIGPAKLEEMLPYIKIGG